MDLAGLARFAPLLRFKDREAGSLGDDELSAIATALAGEQARTFMPLLLKLKSEAPKAKGIEILGTPEAGKIYALLKTQTDADNRVVFCRCPICQTPFETELS